MTRRDFLKLSSLALLPVLSCQNSSSEKTKKYPISIHSDMKIGHLVFQSQFFPISQTIEREYLIVGGGVAGVGAGFELKHKEFALCELSDRLGGSATSRTFQGTTFSQGAHYDLNYPDYFGKEVLQLLDNSKIIEWDSLKNVWRFRDKKYYIKEEQNTSCLYENKFYEGVLIHEQETQKFLDFIEKYIGKLLLPTRLIAPEFRYLDKISFAQYFRKEGFSMSQNLHKGIDYQMIDDFGGTSEEVSALAGLFYYTGRKYGDDRYEDFSPPQGNAYFIDKMISQFPKGSIFRHHLVKKITETKKGFEVEAIHIEKKEIVLFKVRKIIYAGHKHALKYIYPTDFELFAQNQYAPWMVVNLVLNKDALPSETFWQNEILTGEKGFLGFVDSFAQFANQRNHRVLSAYFCLPESERIYLKNIESHAESVILHTLKQMASHFQVQVSDLEDNMIQAFIKVMGHAMPIPYVGYLFREKNRLRKNPNITYAGVDSGRLPLFLEALDSGIVAVNYLK